MDSSEITFIAGVLLIVSVLVYIYVTKNTEGITPIDVIVEDETPETPDPLEQEDLSKLTKVQLLELANSLGLSPPKSHTKAKIIQAIMNASNAD